MTSEEIRAAWLVGTTCACRQKDVREVLFSNATHIVLRHRAHPSYCGRWTGTKNCESYAQLHRIADLLAQTRTYGGYSAKPLIEWKGRLSLVRIRAECKAIGVQFDDNT